MHDKNDPMGLIQEDPELFVRPKLDDGKQKSFLPGGGCLNLNAGRKETNGNVLNFGSDLHPLVSNSVHIHLRGRT